MILRFSDIIKKSDDSKRKEKHVLEVCLDSGDYNVQIWRELMC